MVFREPEGLQHEEREVQNLRDLRFQLFRNAEQMRIVLREAAHPHQAVEHPGALVPVHCPELGIAQRKVPVAAQPRLVDHNMEWTVHRFELIIHPLHLHGRKHVFPVVLGMTAGLPEIQTRDMR